MLTIKSCHLVTKSGRQHDLTAIIAERKFGRQLAVPYVKARKNTKTMSQAAGFALAALEAVASEAEDWRKGLFLSAPAPAASDKSGFGPALRNCDGQAVDFLAKNLGRGMPATGLIGLPNGVMCFGAKTTGAFGPNTVAVNEGVGTHQALAAALRHHRCGTIERAVVCGFGQPNLPANHCLYESMGVLNAAAGSPDEPLQLTDSAVTCELSSEPGPIEVLDAFLYADPTEVPRRLANIGWTPSDVSFVMQPSMPESCAIETAASMGINAPQWSGYQQWGFQAEAAGLLELGMLNYMAAEGRVLSTDRGEIRLDSEQKFLLFGRSFFGQLSCVVGKVNP